MSEERMPAKQRLISDISEMRQWEQYYPKSPGVVLDIGATPGSVAWFYSHGARNVIGIGPDSPMEIANVRRYISAIKLDIEGAERGMVICTHFYAPRLRKIGGCEGAEEVYILEGGEFFPGIDVTRE